MAFGLGLAGLMGGVQGLGLGMSDIADQRFKQQQFDIERARLAEQSRIADAQLAMEQRKQAWAEQANAPLSVEEANQMMSFLYPGRGGGAVSVGGAPAVVTPRDVAVREEIGGPGPFQFSIPGGRPPVPDPGVDVPGGINPAVLTKLPRQVVVPILQEAVKQRMLDQAAGLKDARDQGEAVAAAQQLRAQYPLAIPQTPSGADVFGGEEGATVRPFFQPQDPMPSDTRAFFNLLSGRVPIDRATKLMEFLYPKPIIVQGVDAEGRPTSTAINPHTYQPIGLGPKGESLADTLDLLRRQGILPPLPGGEAGGAPSGVVVSGASGGVYPPPDISVKAGPVNIALKPRGPATNELEAIATTVSGGRTMDWNQLSDSERTSGYNKLLELGSRNIDVLTANDLQSGDPARVARAKQIIGIQQQREASVAGAVAAAKRAEQPLPTELTNQIAGQQQILQAIRQIKSEFTPDEITSFVGLANKPLNEVQQTLAGLGITDVNAKYAKFQVLTNRLKATAFDVGGKQLTPYEGDVVYGFTPTGDERNATQYIEKMDNLEDFTRQGLMVRTELLRAGRGTVSPDELETRLRAITGGGSPERPGWRKSTPGGGRPELPARPRGFTPLPGQ